MQHRLGHECALCDAHSKAALRHTARPHVRTKRYLPWIAPLAFCVLFIPFVDGAARGLLLGTVLGLAAGAGLAWLTTRVNLHIAATTLASATDELKAEADQRVAMVIRQFEWAVNDVANLRDALKRAQDARASAEANEAFLLEQLDLDEGARFIGELGIGCNPGITRHMRNTLFDEKIDGTVHVALGNGLPEAGGENTSQLHWDIVKDMRAAGSRLELDGQVVQEAGRWQL